jgi:ABC-2 type transport system permease protein
MPVVDVVAAALLLLSMSQLPLTRAPWLDALLPLSAGRNLMLEPDVNALSSGRPFAVAVLLAWPLLTALAAWRRLPR